MKNTKKIVVIRGIEIRTLKVVSLKNRLSYDTIKCTSKYKLASLKRLQTKGLLLSIEKEKVNCSVNGVITEMQYETK